MLKKAANNGAHMDIVRDSRHPRSQGADAPHNQVNTPAFLGCPVERLDHFRISQGIHLRQNIALPSGANLVYLPLKQFQQSLLQGKRRMKQLVELEGFTHSRQLLEDAMNIPA